MQGLGWPKPHDPVQGLRVLMAEGSPEHLRSSPPVGLDEDLQEIEQAFFSKAMVDRLRSLEVHFLLKVPDHHRVRRELGPMRRFAKSLEITKDPALGIWSAGGRGTLYGARFLSLEWRRTESDPVEFFDRLRITQRSLTNFPGIHPDGLEGLQRRLRR